MACMEWAWWHAGCRGSSFCAFSSSTMLFSATQCMRHVTLHLVVCLGGSYPFVCDGVCATRVVVCSAWRRRSFRSHFIFHHAVFCNAARETCATAPSGAPGWVLP